FSTNMESGKVGHQSPTGVAALKQADVNDCSSVTHWMSGGEPISPPDIEADDMYREFQLFGDGLIKIVERAEGTTISWMLFAPNWTTIYFVMSRIETLPGPYNLLFFLAGWFNETFHE